MEGFLIIDKPQGITSADVVYRVKRMLPKGTKIGHAGTLDPNVTGVLPLALGRATKAFAFLDDTQKVYRATMQLGLSTDTEDIWGNVIEDQLEWLLDHNAMPSEAVVHQVLLGMIGPYLQTPPMFSAKKVKGKKLYDLARQGQTIERDQVQKQIYSIEDIKIDMPNISFTICCSRGTYIRTFCVDAGKKMGTLACMSSLKRLSTGQFPIDKAISLQSLLDQPATIQEAILPTAYMFQNIESIQVDLNYARHLLNGVKVDLMRFYKKNMHLNQGQEKLFKVVFEENLLGIAVGVDSKIEMRQLFWHKEDLESFVSLK